MIERLFNDYFLIQNKDGNRQVFRPNAAQMRLREYQKTHNRILLLKARQLGITTHEKMDDLDVALVQHDKHVLTIADNIDNAEAIFKKIKYAFDNLPPLVKETMAVRYNSIRELEFAATNSSIKVDTSARSGTFQRVHISEFAFFSPDKVNDVLEGTFPAIPASGYLIIESTANGFNHFSQLWSDAEAGKNEFCPVFINWTVAPEYTLEPAPGQDVLGEYAEIARDFELYPDPMAQFGITVGQLNWYMQKARILRHKVKQEYPFDALECFLATGKFVFNQSRVKAIQPQVPVKVLEGVDIYIDVQPGHEYVVGIDTSEGTENDASGLLVYDKADMDFVGAFRDDTIRPDQLGVKAMAIGKYFNEALLIPERNNTGLTTVLTIHNAGYKNLFLEVSIDKQKQTEKETMGWRTTATNRDMMIDEYNRLFEEGQLGIFCPHMVREMQTFVKKPNGKREHENGFHDDMLFAAFLCIQGAKVQHFKARVFQRKAI
jgi:hypothetical protein